MKKSISIIALLAASTVTYAQEKVLFVGNSFTHGHAAPAKFYNSANVTDANGLGYGGVPGIFKKFTTQAGLDYDVTIEAISSKTLAYHLANKSAIIGDGSWDAVVLQDQSTRPLPTAHGGNPTAYFNAADGLMDLIKNANASTEVILYQTWSSPTSANDKGYGGDLQAMQDDLQDIIYQGYYRSVRTLGQHSDFDGVGRVGDAFMHAIDQGYADSDPSDGITSGLAYLWGTDDRHAGPEGSYLSAAVMYGRITGCDPRTIDTDTGSAAEDLGISSLHAQQLQSVAYDILQLDDPAAPPPPTPVINLLIPGLSPFNWNKSTSWDNGPLDESQSVLIDASSPENSIVANSTTGSPTDSVQSISFDIGASTKSVQGNATVSSTRILNLSGGLDALGGFDLIRLSSTTTGLLNFGTNSGLGILQITPAVNGSIRVENAEGTLLIGPTAQLVGNVSLTKSGDGILILEGASSFGGGSGNQFTIEAGFVQADTPSVGTDSATGQAAVVVETDGVLGGNGQVTPASGKQVLVDGGQLSPGSRDADSGISSLGTLTLNGALTGETLLTLNNTARLVFDLDSDGVDDRQSDEIHIASAQAGDVAFNGNEISFNVLSTDLLPAGEYTLITADAADAFSGLTTDVDGYVTSGANIGSGLDDYQARLRRVGNDLLIELAPLPIAQWKAAFFSPVERQDPSISGDAATPAGDGVENLVKYAFDLDPHQVEPQGLPWVKTMLLEDIPTPVFCFLRSISATDLNYVVEVSNDLKLWLSGPDYSTEIDQSDNSDGRTQTITVQPAAGYSFIRLNITRN